MNEFTLRGPHREVIDTGGKWRQLVLAQKWGLGKPLTALAERWTTTSLPEIDELCASQPATNGFTIEEGWVGGDLDVAVVGAAPGGRTLLAALPAADEPFGPAVGEVMGESRRRYSRSSSVDLEAELVFGVEASVFSELRYRLLQVSAALVKKAREQTCVQAVLVIHEFRSPLTPRQVAADQLADVEEFVLRLSHRQWTAKAIGRLVGPMTNTFPLYIGRALVER